MPGPNTNIDLITQAVLNKARKDKFTLIVNIPPALKNLNYSKLRLDRLMNLDALQYSLYNCPVPKITTPRIDVPYKGQTPYVTSYARSPYETVLANFVVDNKFQNYWFIWKWLDSLHGATEGIYKATEMGGIDDSKDKYLYTTDFHLFGRDEYNNPIIRFDYKDCFIVSLDRIEYNQRDAEEITCGFEFSFNQLDVVLLDNYSIN